MPTSDSLATTSLVLSIAVAAIAVALGARQWSEQAARETDLAADDSKYHRLRDELWFLGRAWFAARNSRIPARCERLISELTTPLYDFNASGAIVVEPKKMFKKRLLRSPNQADAMLNTFARRDQKLKPKNRWKNQHEGASAWAS